MIYYRDDELVIRNMEEADAQIFYDAYLAQGWHPEITVYQMRLKDQAEGRCVALTAEYRGHPAGSVYVYRTPHGGPFKGQDLPEISAAEPRREGRLLRTDLRRTCCRLRRFF